MSATTERRVLSRAQLELLAERGEERVAEVGETLFRIGDESYPLMAILEGEAVVLDAAGQEIARHGPSGFLGEINLLSGQTVFLTGVVTERMRYIAVEREVLRDLLFEDSALGDLLLTAFVERRELLQRRQGVGFEIFGSRDSPDARRLVDFARRQRLPYTWVESSAPDRVGDAESSSASDGPIVRLPGGVELHDPSNGELSRALGIGLELAPVEEVDLLVIGAGPAGIGGAVYGASEGLDTLVIESGGLGGQAGTSRRIENYLGFPAGISGGELTSRAITQARKFGARFASPYRAKVLEAGDGGAIVTLDEGNEIRARAVLLATGAEYRRLPVEDIEHYEGTSVFYAAGPMEGQLCAAQRVGVVGGGNSAGQAAVWLARGGALVTLLHRRADLSETMSRYLIDELVRYGVEVHDRAEVRQLHGEGGHLSAVTLSDGEEMRMGYLFLFLGAAPCTEWLDDTVARDAKGFVLTGPDAGAGRLLQTSSPGVFAAGDVRAGSTKRCATAVGEGAEVVRLVHEHLAAPAPVAN